MRPDGPIKVLIVDGSAVVRSTLARMLRGEANIDVVASVGDTAAGRRKVLEYKPDVIVLDIELSGNSAITFLRVLRIHYPVPVIVCASAEALQSDAANEALEAGAFQVVCRPSATSANPIHQLARRLAGQIRAAQVSHPAAAGQPPLAEIRAESLSSRGVNPEDFLVAIGASTGGTEALRRLLACVPPDFPPVVMVQHMPAGFTRAFAGRLNQSSPLTVSEAIDGECVRSGFAVLARGDIQMSVQRERDQWHVRYGSTETYNRHCPSVDVLFNSVAEAAGSRAVGIVLTGMGDDGSRGLLKMREAGARTFAQDKESCVVYGMPKAAAEIGAVECVGPPEEIPRRVIKALSRACRASSAPR